MAYSLRREWKLNINSRFTLVMVLFISVCPKRQVFLNVDAPRPETTLSNGAQNTISGRKLLMRAPVIVINDSQAHLASSRDDCITLTLSITLAGEFLRVVNIPTADLDFRKKWTNKSAINFTQ